MAVTTTQILTWGSKLRDSCELVENKQSIMRAHLVTVNDTAGLALMDDIDNAQAHHHSDHLNGAWCDMVTGWPIDPSLLDPSSTIPTPSGPIRKPPHST